MLACHCAQKLVALRAAAGETQRQAAARLQMTESMISRLERGDHVPSLTTLQRIAQAYGCRLEIIFHAQALQHADAIRGRPHDHDDPDHQHAHGAKE
jgi:transcriptional regulator with XRE-family HTH domain